MEIIEYFSSEKREHWLSEIEKSDSCYEIFSKRINDIAVALNNTQAVLDAEALEKAAKTIMNAKRLFVNLLSS